MGVGDHREFQWLGVAASMSRLPMAPPGNTKCRGDANNKDGTMRVLCEEALSEFFLAAQLTSVQ